MDSLYITEQIRHKLNFKSSNGDGYIFTARIDDLIDMKYHFSLFIEGKINDMHKPLINQAIIYTWNLTAYQTRNFISYFAKQYKFTFLDSSELDVDIDGKLQTKIIYFMSPTVMSSPATSNSKYACKDDFELTPRITWLQDSMLKYDLPYSLLDGNDESIKPYNKLYYIDFEGYIDPLFEEDIKSSILTSFRQAYKGRKYINFHTVLCQ